MTHIISEAIATIIAVVSTIIGIKSALSHNWWGALLMLFALILAVTTILIV